MALPGNASPINISDTIADTIKTTAGYFTNGDGTLAGNEIFHDNTGEISVDNNNSSKAISTINNHYWNINQLTASHQNTETQFSVAFAHQNGSGSDCTGDGTTGDTIWGPTKALYAQLAETLLLDTDYTPGKAEGGFKIASTLMTSTTGLNLGTDNQDEYIYVLSFQRDKFKDRVNKKAWTLSLSGSTSNHSGSGIHLTDDSANVAAVATPGGPRYNIVSGTIGTVTEPATTKTYGWFYPEMGLMLFSGAALSSSIPGVGSGSVWGAKENITSSIMDPKWLYDTDNIVTGSGFAPNLTNTANAHNALKLAFCMRNMKASNTLKIRSEEDQTQENYFCRIRAEEYNFSSNHTFVSGSKNKIRAADMHGNPTTFITGVGLYNSAGQLLAIAKLSKPLKKTFASEATIKVKLTY